eukprot:7377188-Prymnesium_polylepis.6
MAGTTAAVTAPVTVTVTVQWTQQAQGYAPAAASSRSSSPSRPESGRTSSTIRCECQAAFSSETRGSRTAACPAPSNRNRSPFGRWPR